jgi:tetratricopeptide (TPR) repeat protein
MNMLTRNKFHDPSKFFLDTIIIYLIFLCGPVWSETGGPLKLPKVEGSKSFDLEISQINRLAIKKYQQGLFEMAAEHFKKAVNIAQQLRDPSQGILYFNLALSLHKSGHYEKAAKQFYSARRFARGNSQILESELLKTHE